MHLLSQGFDCAPLSSLRLSRSKQIEPCLTLLGPAAQQPHAPGISKNKLNFFEMGHNVKQIESGSKELDNRPSGEAARYTVQGSLIR